MRGYQICKHLDVRGICVLYLNCMLFISHTFVSIFSFISFIFHIVLFYFVSKKFGMYSFRIISVLKCGIHLKIPYRLTVHLYIGNGLGLCKLNTCVKLCNCVCSWFLIYRPQTYFFYSPQSILHKITTSIYNIHNKIISLQDGCELRNMFFF